MARFLTPKTTGSAGIELLNGSMELRFEDPVPLPLKNHRPQDVFGGGARVSTVNMPTKIRFNGRQRKLVDLLNGNHMYMVSQRLVDLIGSFEKRLQAFPIECTWADGSLAGNFFFLFTNVLVDAVNRAETTADWHQVTPDAGLWHLNLHDGQMMVFDKSRLTDIHMWVDPNMAIKRAVISEELYHALVEANIASFHDPVHLPEI